MDPAEDPRVDSTTRDRITDLEERQEKKFGQIDDVLKLGQRAVVVIGVLVVLALVGGAFALRGIHSESVKRTNAINDSRRFNTIQSCLAESDKNGVIRQFILFATHKDKTGRLYLESVRVFPVKDRVQCVREAGAKVRS